MLKLGDSGRKRSQIGGTRPINSQVLPTPGHIWSKPAQFTRTRTECGRFEGQLRPLFGRSRPNISRTQPGSGHIWPASSGPILPELGRVRPTWPVPASVDRRYVYKCLRMRLTRTCPRAHLRKSCVRAATGGAFYPHTCMRSSCVHNKAPRGEGAAVALKAQQRTEGRRARTRHRHETYKRLPGDVHTVSRRTNMN